MGNDGRLPCEGKAEYLLYESAVRAARWLTKETSKPHTVFWCSYHRTWHVGTRAATVDKRTRGRREKAR